LTNNAIHYWRIEKIKKIYGILILVVLIAVATLCITVMVNNDGVGPAPNSGDGVPDGSG